MGDDDAHLIRRFLASPALSLPLLTAFLVLSTPANADHVTLECVTIVSPTEHKPADLVIDLHASRMRWEEIEYDIVHVNDDYIAAYEKATGGPRSVGGEVWVFNRRTSDVLRGSVFMELSAGKSSEEEIPQALVIRGRFFGNMGSKYLYMSPAYCSCMAQRIRTNEHEIDDWITSKEQHSVETFGSDPIMAELLQQCAVDAADLVMQN